MVTKRQFNYFQQSYSDLISERYRNRTEIYDFMDGPLFPWDILLVKNRMIKVLKERGGMAYYFWAFKAYLQA